MTGLVAEQVSARSLPALDIAARGGAAPDPATATEINNLMQAYALFCDFGRADELAALFTKDATWDGREIGYGQAAGPSGIAKAVVGHFSTDRPMVHLPGPPLLAEVSPTEVQAYSWCMATRLTDGTTSPPIYFGYEDQIWRESGRWLFRHRLLRLRFRGAPS